MGCCYSRTDEDCTEERYADKKFVERQKPACDMSRNSLSNSRVALLNPAEKLKEQGNQYFKKKNYSLAILSYEQALTQKISSIPDLSYYTNLALAYKNSQQYRKAVETIDQMTRQSSLTPQAHSSLYRKGLATKARALCMQVKDYCLSGKFTVKNNHDFLSCIDTAIQILERVSSAQPGDDYFEFLGTANKIRQFLTQTVLPKSQSQNLLNYLHSKFQLEELSFEESKVANYFSSREQMMIELEDTVQRLKKGAMEEEKDFLLDPITYESLLDPVIVPSGITYNKTTLLEHFKNNGYNDPITHQEYVVGKQVILPNFSLKGYVNEARKTLTHDDLYLLRY